MLRSILAVAGGYFAMAVLVMASTFMLAALFSIALDPAESQPVTLPAGYLYCNLAAGFVGAVGGGVVTALIAPHARLRHGLILAGLLVVMGVMFAMSAQGHPAPSWYFVAVPALGVIGALAGVGLCEGFIGKRRMAS